MKQLTSINIQHSLVDQRKAEVENREKQKNEQVKFRDQIIKLQEDEKNKNMQEKMNRQNAQS